MVQHTIRIRWSATALMLGLAALAIALLVIQSARAGDSDQPGTLKPPFVFEPMAAAAGADFLPLPPEATPLLTETFGTGFQPTFGPVVTTTKWYIITETGSANFYWNRVIPALSTTYQDTAWAACGTCDGSPGTSRNPDTDNYVPGMDTWMIYGPIDLSKYNDAELTFSYNLNANPAVDGSGTGDFFGYGITDDGTHFVGVPVTGNSGGWVTGTLRLTDYAGRPYVYIGFYLHSNDDANVAKGVFVDNVSLRAVPLKITYLSLVYKQYSSGTTVPTPGTYLYRYVWDSGLGENDPDFIAWGQSYTSGSNPVVYEQGLTGGNPGNGMYLYNTQTSLVSMAGPNVTVSGNYEISAQFDVYKGKNNARYGIVFGADTNAFGRNGSIPTFNPNTNYYRFVLQFPGASGDDPVDFQLEKCNTGNGTNCSKLINRTTIPSGANADGVWDTLTVRRVGSSITVLVNGVQIGTASDSTYTGAREFGTTIVSGEVNGTSNPLEVDWDNFTVTQLP